MELPVIPEVSRTCNACNIEVCFSLALVYFQNVIVRPGFIVRKPPETFEFQLKTLSFSTVGDEWALSAYIGGYVAVRVCARK